VVAVVEHSFNVLAVECFVDELLLRRIKTHIVFEELYSLQLKTESLSLDDKRTTTDFSLFSI